MTLNLRRPAEPPPPPYPSPQGGGKIPYIVRAEVTELIQGTMVAMNLETTEEDLMHTVFPHPTLSAMMHESALDAYGQVIHS